MNIGKYLNEGISPKNMITSYELDRALKNLEEAKRITKSEMPKGDFVFVGFTKEHVYFNVVARLKNTNSQEMTDIKQKTRFEQLEEFLSPIYKGQFRMRIM